MPRTWMTKSRSSLQAGRRPATRRGCLYLSLFLVGFAFFLPAQAAEPDPLNAALVAEGVDPDLSALVILRLEDGRSWTSGGARADERFVPASTAKIPHLLLALEAGIVSGPEQVFAWDGQTRPVAAWNEDQTLAEAFARSTVWVYQRLVPAIGAERLQAGLANFGYGNADIGGPGDLDRYWLSGPLAISAREQVAFIGRLAGRTLPLSASTYDRALPVMRVAQGQGWVLSGKTGMARLQDGRELGWFVGWLEQSAGPAPGTYLFALNMDMPAGMQDAPRRRAAVEQALRQIRALPAALVPD